MLCSRPWKIRSTPARLSPRLPSAPLHSALGDLPAKGKFEIDTLFNLQHPGSESTVSSEIASAAEGRKKPGHYSEAAAEADMSSDVEVGCSALRSPGGLAAAPLKENNGKGNRAALAGLSGRILPVPPRLLLALPTAFAPNRPSFASKLHPAGSGGGGTHAGDPAFPLCSLSLPARHRPGGFQARQPAIARVLENVSAGCSKSLCELTDP